MKTILISHINSNKELARSLKLTLETIYDNLDVVVKILNIEQDNKIFEHLYNCNCFIILCDSTSINKPLINFEIGFARGKEKKIILVSASDIKQDEIPNYILSDPEITVNRLDELNNINRVVSKELEINFKECRLISDSNKILTDDYQKVNKLLYNKYVTIDDLLSQNIEFLKIAICQGLSPIGKQKKFKNIDLVLENSIYLINKSLFISTFNERVYELIFNLYKILLNNCRACLPIIKDLNLRKIILKFLSYEIFFEVAKKDFDILLSASDDINNLLTEDNLKKFFVNYKINKDALIENIYYPFIKMFELLKKLVETINSYEEYIKHAIVNKGTL